MDIANLSELPVVSNPFRLHRANKPSPQRRRLHEDHAQQHKAVLLPHHAEMLAESAIRPEVVRARGYFSVTKESEAEELGFADYQRRVPALVIPIRDVTGNVALYQLRPDTPRIDQNGKARKYENQVGGRMALDVPLSVREHLNNPQYDLWLTEGAKKVDSALSHGLLCIGVLGVYGWRGTNQHGGRTALPDWEDIALNGRTIYLAFDSDVMTKPAVYDALTRLKHFLEVRQGIVKIVYLESHANVEKVGLDDFFASGGSAQTLIEKAETTLRPPQATVVLSTQNQQTAEKDFHLTDLGNAERLVHQHGDASFAAEPPAIPEIPITTNITEMVDAAEDALIKLPGPVLYQRAKQICRIAPAGQSPKWLQRPPDAPTIIRAETVSLRELSGQSAQWKKFDKREKEWSPALPPTYIFETLAARVEWKFPYLESVICAPTLRPDGVLVSKPGYDENTRLYLDLNGMQFPPVPEFPTRDDAKAALDTLFVPFADFPFKDDCHRSAAIAATLTLVARYAIQGNVPAFPVRAHTKGTGKGLLVNTIATIGTGRTAPTWTQTLDQAEEAKRLLSIALAGDACMHIDNITHPFGSAPLDSALTSPTVKDRLLGTNDNQEAPWLTVIFASGNNMTFVGDMARRVVPIDLDSKVEHPEERDNFRHTPLLEWVRTERPRLVIAALTVLKAFFVAGCPKQPGIPEFGSYERWSDLIRHSLIWAGFPDPCGDRKNIEEESDTSYEALATLLQCWTDCYPDTEARTLKVVTQDIERRQTPDPGPLTPANEWNALHDALSAYDAKYDGKRLDTKRIGNALRTVEGRVLGNQRLVRAGEFRRAALWKRELLK